MEEESLTLIHYDPEAERIAQEELEQKYEKQAARDLENLLFIQD